ncbi:MAG TPA: hypothetical protein VJR71_06055 [Pseudolabrys sp.]|nr:hypothetical protein [Pseudolabrys sp.]
MKTIVKLTAASLLALSAIAPAFAAEEDTLLERSGVIVNTRPVHQPIARAHRATDAYAATGVVIRNPYDFGIEGQGN